MSSWRLRKAGRWLRPDLIGQARPQPVQAGGGDAAKDPPDLTWPGGAEVAQTDDRSLVQAAASEIRVAGLEEFIPVWCERVPPRAEAGHQDGLIGAGEQRKDQRGPELGRPHSVQERKQHHVAWIHGSSS